MKLDEKIRKLDVSPKILCLFVFWPQHLQVTARVCICNVFVFANVFIHKLWFMQIPDHVCCYRPAVSFTSSLRRDGQMLAVLQELLKLFYIMSSLLLLISRLYNLFLLHRNDKCLQTDTEVAEFRHTEHNWTLLLQFTTWQSGLCFHWNCKLNKKNKKCIKVNFFKQLKHSNFVSFFFFPTFQLCSFFNLGQLKSNMSVKMKPGLSKAFLQKIQLCLNASNIDKCVFLNQCIKAKHLGRMHYSF